MIMIMVIIVVVIMMMFIIIIIVIVIVVMMIMFVVVVVVGILRVGRIVCIPRHVSGIVISTHILNQFRIVTLSERNRGGLSRCD